MPDIAERLKYQLGSLMVQNTALAAELEEVKTKLAKLEPKKDDKKEK